MADNGSAARPCASDRKLASKRVGYSDAEIARARRLRSGGYTLREISARMGRPISGLSKLERRGWRRKSAPDRPCPGDLSLQAGRLTVLQLQAHYRVGNRQLHAWLASKGIAMPDRQHRQPTRARPDDFGDQAAIRGVRDLCRHYAASYSTVARWMAEVGVPLKRAKAAPANQVGWVERFVADQRRAASALYHQRENHL